MQAHRFFFVWTAIFFAVFMIAAAFGSRDVKLIASVAPGIAAYVAGLAVPLTVALIGFPGLARPWARRGFLGLGNAIPLIEAAIVRVDPTRAELRKQVLGRTLWLVPRQNIHLVMDDRGAFQVLEINRPKGL